MAATLVGAYPRLGGRCARALPAADFSAFVAFGLFSVLPAFWPAFFPVGTGLHLLSCKLESNFLSTLPTL